MKVKLWDNTGPGIHCQGPSTHALVCPKIPGVIVISFGNHSAYSSDFAMAYSVEFREAVAYSLSCLRALTSEIRRVYGMVSKRKLRLPQVFWDKPAHAC